MFYMVGTITYSRNIIFVRYRIKRDIVSVDMTIPTPHDCSHGSAPVLSFTSFVNRMQTMIVKYHISETIKAKNMIFTGMKELNTRHL